MASTPVHILVFVVEGTGVRHAVGQNHSLGTTDLQDAPLDGGVCEVVPSLSIAPSVVLFAIRRTGDSSRSVQPVVAFAANLRVVVRPLRLLQLAVERGICNHVAISQRVIIDSIKTAIDHLVGRIRSIQDTLPPRHLLRWLFVIRRRLVLMLISYAADWNYKYTIGTLICVLTYSRKYHHKRRLGHTCGVDGIG